MRCATNSNLGHSPAGDFTGCLSHPIGLRYLAPGRCRLSEHAAYCAAVAQRHPFRRACPERSRTVCFDVRQDLAARKCHTRTKRSWPHAPMLHAARPHPHAPSRHAVMPPWRMPPCPHAVCRHARCRDFTCATPCATRPLPTDTQSPRSVVSRTRSSPPASGHRTQHERLRLSSDQPHVRSRFR